VARRLLTALDLVKNELQNGVIQNLASAPSSPVNGQVYYDTTLGQFGCYQAGSWVYLATGLGLDNTATDYTNSAVGDTRAAGSSGQAAHADHRHGRESFATPSIALGTAAAAGSATTPIRSDATIVAFDTTAPSSSAVGDAGAVGSATVASRRDHTHAREAFAAPTAETTYGTSSATGTATTIPHADHQHGNPTHVDGDHSAIHLSALAAPSADVSMNSHKLTNVTDPTNPQDAATKNYVDSIAQGVNWKSAVAAATTAALAANTYANGTSGVGATLTGNSNGALAAIDGYTPAANDRLLIKNEATASHNGIYTVTQVGDGTHPFILTRVTDMDTATEIAGAAVLVLNGTTNVNQGWIVDSAGPYTVGTTSITFTQFTGVADITAGGGISKSGNTITANTRGYASTITGDDSTTTFNQSHNLGTTDTQVMMQDPGSSPANQFVEADFYAVDSNTSRVVFATAPANGKTYRVITTAVIVNG
jgi:hypothetical protein